LGSNRGNVGRWNRESGLGWEETGILSECSVQIGKNQDEMGGVLRGKNSQSYSKEVNTCVLCRSGLLR